jgi:hypothetical protein
MIAPSIIPLIISGYLWGDDNQHFNAYNLDGDRLSILSVNSSSSHRPNPPTSLMSPKRNGSPLFQCSLTAISKSLQCFLPKSTIFWTASSIVHLISSHTANLLELSCKIGSIEFQIQKPTTSVRAIGRLLTPEAYKMITKRATDEFRSGEPIRRRWEDVPSNWSNWGQKSLVLDSGTSRWWEMSGAGQMRVRLAVESRAWCFCLKPHFWIVSLIIG